MPLSITLPAGHPAQRRPTADEGTLREVLRFCADAAAQAPRPGYAYTSPYQFVLEHGFWFVPRALPAGFTHGAPRMCFGNAIVACVKWPGLRYVEGYAAPRGYNALPVHHAWNLDADGLLVDITWEKPGLAYVGVEFSLERADDCTWNGDANVLDDWHRGWPLLRERWTGERPIPGYEPTEAMRLAYQMSGRKPSC